jgi:hypothetical protein
MNDRRAKFKMGLAFRGPKLSFDDFEQKAKKLILEVKQ